LISSGANDRYKACRGILSNGHSSKVSSVWAVRRLDRVTAGVQDLYIYSAASVKTSVIGVLNNAVIYQLQSGASGIGIYLSVSVCVGN
jgi:hypothetical protein